MLGSIIRRLLTEELLIDLQSSLQSIDDNDNVASPVVDYMRALRELYHICVTKDLDSNFAKYIQSYLGRIGSFFLEEAGGVT